MKNVLTLSIALCLTLFISCAQGENLCTNQSAQGELYEVTFGVGDLHTEISSFNSKTAKSTALTVGDLKHFQYWVYSNANLVMQRCLDVDEITKPITVSLPKGEFTIYVYVADKEIALEEGKNYTPFNAPTAYWQTQTLWGQQAFSVSDNSFNINVIELQNTARAKVELVIEDLDKLPEEIQSITPVLVGSMMLSGSRSLMTPKSVFDITRMSEYYVDYDTNIQEVSYYVPHSAKTLSATPVFRRSEFAKVSKDNPIVFYTMPIGSMGVIGSVYTSFTLYIQGARDNQLHEVSMNSLIEGQNPKLAFMKQVKPLTLDCGQTIRFTGNIGYSEESGIDVTANDKWNEVITNIDSE